MNYETREYINKLADCVRDVYKIPFPVEDMAPIVKEIGGEIEEKIDLNSYCDGTIRKIPDNSFHIAISPTQNRQRKNFTIAHELGHLFLHMGYGISKEVWEKQDEVEYRRFGASEQEYQANEFAAALLMPREGYLREFKNLVKNGSVDMERVAEKLNVSLSAAINRGRFLGVLS
jgi:DUF955